MNQTLKNFFIGQNIYDEEFEAFMEGKVLIVPNTTDLSWYGCFPIVKDNVLTDIRLLVPEIENDQDLLINIHEYAHALELYSELGKIYEDKVELRESRAREMEKVYLKSN